MLALYDKNWNQIDFMSTAFSDQAEKFLFWRNVADRATYLKAFSLVWVSESWLRDLKGHQSHPISAPLTTTLGGKTSIGVEWRASRRYT